MFKIENYFLSDVKYHFDITDLEQIVISISDQVEMKEVDGTEALLDVSRILNFTDEDGTSFAGATYAVQISLPEPMDKKQLIEVLQKNVTRFNVIFSKLSLILSQLSNESPVRIIITPPGCRPEDVVDGTEDE